MSAENASTSSIVDTGEDEHDPYFNTEPAPRWRYHEVHTRCVTPVDDGVDDADTDDDLDWAPVPTRATHDTRNVPEWSWARSRAIGRGMYGPVYFEASSGRLPKDCGEGDFGDDADTYDDLDWAPVPNRATYDTRNVPEWSWARSRAIGRGMYGPVYFESSSGRLPTDCGEVDFGDTLAQPPGADRGQRLRQIS